MGSEPVTWLSRSVRPRATKRRDKAKSTVFEVVQANPQSRVAHLLDHLALDQRVRGRA